MRVGGKMAAAAAVLAVLAAGCGREATFAPIEVGAKDFSFAGMPASIQGGAVTVTLHNEGKVFHEMAMINVGNASIEDFKRDFPKLVQGGPFPKFFKAGTVPFDVGPGDTDTHTFTLSPGKYLLLCALQGDPAKLKGGQPAASEEEEPQGAFHYERGMYQWLNVEGEGGKLSAPDGEIVAKDYSFDVPQLKGGRNHLVFRNAGPKQWHFGELEEFPLGVTEAQALKAFEFFIKSPNPETAKPPPGSPKSESVGFAGIYSPGFGATWDVTLKPGTTYILACFLSDLTGGPPHAIGHHMYKAFTVK